MTFYFSQDFCREFLCFVQADREIPERVGSSDDRMLTSNTSTTSMSSLPRIKKKTKSTPSPSGGSSGGVAIAGSSLQDVSLDYGFRDEKENSRPSRSKNVAKSRSKDQKDRSRLGRDDRKSDRQVSQSKKKVSQRSETPAEQSGHFSRRSDSSRRSVSSERRSEREAQRRQRNEKFKAELKAEKVVKKESSKISRRITDKIPLGPKNSNSPRSVRRANDDIRSQLAGSSDIRLRQTPSSSSKPASTSKPSSSSKPASKPVSSSKSSSSSLKPSKPSDPGSKSSSKKKVATKKAVVPPPATSEASLPPIVTPAALPDGAEMTFKYDATNGKWVLPTLPGFSFVFTGAPEVAKPAAPPSLPSVGTPSSAAQTPKSRRKYTKVSGRISGSDDDDEDDDGDDVMSPPADYSKYAVEKDRDFRRGQSSCAVSETSDCTTVTNPSRDSSDDDVVMDDASTGSSTPRRKSDSGSSDSSSSSSSSSDSDSESDGESDDSRDADPDALKIDTDSEFHQSEDEVQHHSGYVMVGTDGSGDTSGNDGRRVEDEAEDEAEVANDANPANPVDPARVVNPPAPVADVPADEPVAILDDAEFGRILNDLIDRNVPHVEIDAFRRDVPRHAWSGTVNVIRRQNREREHFRARIRYLRGLANPTDAEKEELQNMIVFQ